MRGDDSGDRKPRVVDSIKVEAPAKVEASVKVDTIFDAWEKLVESPTQELYAGNLVEFQDACKDHPKFLEYVETTILKPFKDKLVRAWTDLVLHLGCRTTNRVEGAHGVVKEYLSTSKCDLGTCWHKIDEMLANQFGEIQSSFGRSVTVLEHKYKDVTLYSGLGGHMSRQAMNFIFVEEARARKTLCIEKKTCGCVQRTSYDLLCACFIAVKIRHNNNEDFFSVAEEWRGIQDWMKIRHNKPIRLDEIHPHWHKLYIGEEESNEDFFSVAEEWRGIQERLERVPFQMKLEIKEGMRLLAFSETTMSSPPPKKVSTKGSIFTTKKSSQPKRKGARIGISPVPVPKPSLVSKNYDPSNPMYYMPKFMRPYIEGIVDVIGDGHCGFRAIAERVGLTEESHVMVRRALIKELKEHRNKYIEVYASASVTSTFWMDCILPKILVITTLDIGVSETFFPLRGAPPVNPKSNMICIGLIPNHFVILSLKDGCPLPPSSTKWRNHRSDEANTWDYEFFDQHDRFRALMEIEDKERPVPPNKQTNEDNPIMFDDTPVKKYEKFEDVIEHLDDLLLLDEI
ncbi:hypothetical protein MTR_7g069450 [Medicago truncatula]|uniref:OTU domain-containing protein n=1 Tax=Medicago truncatula TaxID=3880 RepID=G7KSA8_MEDTR|nr:hypothetical protein MTR_7g069450 [Medicago truncatula]